MTNLDNTLTTRSAARSSLRGLLSSTDTGNPTSQPASGTLPSAFDLLLEEHRSLDTASLHRSAPGSPSRGAWEPGSEQPGRSRADRSDAEPSTASERPARSDRSEPARSNDRVDRHDDDRGPDPHDDKAVARPTASDASDRTDDVDRTDDGSTDDGAIDEASDQTAIGETASEQSAIDQTAIDQTAVDPTALAMAGLLMAVESPTSTAPVTVSGSSLTVDTVTEATAPIIDPSDTVVDPAGAIDLAVAAAVAISDEAVEAPTEGVGDEPSTFGVDPTSSTTSRSVDEPSTAIAAVAAGASNQGSDSESDADDDPAAAAIEPTIAPTAQQPVESNDVVDAQPMIDSSPDVVALEAPTAAEPATAVEATTAPSGQRVDGVNNVQQQRSTEAAASAVPVSAPVAAEFDGEVWEQVQKAVDLVRQNGPGRHEVSVVLRPDDLGSVSVELVQRNGEVAVRIVTQTAAAQDRLDRARLLTELQSAGIDPSSVDISHRESGRSGQGSGGDGSRSDSSPGRDSGAGPVVGPARIIGRSAARAGTANGGVDLAL